MPEGMIIFFIMITKVLVIYAKHKFILLTYYPESAKVNSWGHWNQGILSCCLAIFHLECLLWSKLLLDFYQLVCISANRKEMGERNAWPPILKDMFWKS